MKNVIFALPYGGILGIVGENGAGKTLISYPVLDIILSYQDLLNYD